MGDIIYYNGIIFSFSKVNDVKKWKFALHLKFRVRESDEKYIYIFYLSWINTFVVFFDAFQEYFFNSNIVLDF